jgi:hypothetical protein
MNLLKVPFITPDRFEADLVQQHSIRFQPWTTASLLNCTANFSIAHFNEGICIHYEVCEPFLKARRRTLNGDVHKDNCVEFFINFNNDDLYYNFEFNCLGSVKGGYGNNRTNREQLPYELVKKIEDQISIEISNLHESKFIQWSITIIIPIEAFHHSKLQSLRGLNGTCNFTKCGDELPDPHYLSWVNIENDYPDFHKPSFFGKMQFE